MKNKFLAVVLCLAFMTVPLCSCGQSESTEPEEQKISDQVESADGQSTDSLFNTLKKMCFYDVPLSFPCKFNTLSDHFTLGSGFYFEEVDYTYYELLYQGEKVASIGISGEKSDQNDDKDVVMIVIEDEQLAALTIADEPCNVDINRMVDLFGTPDNQSVDEWKALLEYNTENMDITIIFNDGQAHEITFVKHD